MRTILLTEGQGIYVQVVGLTDLIILRVRYKSDAPGWAPALDIQFDITEEDLAIQMANVMLRQSNDRLVAALLSESAAAQSQLEHIRQIVVNPDARDTV